MTVQLENGVVADVSASDAKKIAAMAGILESGEKKNGDYLNCLS